MRKHHLGNLTMSYTFDQVPGQLSLSPSAGSTSCIQDIDEVWGGLSSYMQAYYPEFDLSQTAWFSPLFLMDQSDRAVSSGASFSIVFSMSIYQPKNQAKANCSLVFAIQPDVHIKNLYETYDSSMFDQSENHTFGIVAGSLVSSMIAVDSSENTILLRVDIEQLGNSSMANIYSMWIDYHHVKQHMSVFVGAGDEGALKPADDMISTILNGMMPSHLSFSFFSSIGQLWQLRTWNSTIQRLQKLSCYGPYYVPSHPYAFTSQGLSLAFILPLSLGLAAVTVFTPVVVYFYFTSKYRKWKKEHDKLAKTMRHLPGMPSRIEYADIKKATKNFHETMKLGKGGFGAVYRCTLRVAASTSTSKTSQSMDVAVKKFMREVDEDQRYDDFQAEVSIINRLRHKNIVPLIAYPVPVVQQISGWSYNKGEPILIYEYMTNGSLDQHIFQKSGSTRPRQQQQDDTSISQWQTRYSIAKDIATGLHYVHHEHEPMVLHRDIKASNIMVDSTFHARLGDFGTASIVAVDRGSVTGIAAPEYAMTYKSTRQTDTYAFGVLILEVVTGKKKGDVPPDNDHITDWGKLLDAVDSSLLTDVEGDQSDDFIEEAHRLLLLGLASTNPNPSNRPSMAEAVQVITKLMPPPDRLSASVGEAARNPDAPYAVAASMAMDLSQLMSGDDRLGQIGLFSSVGQLAQLQAWNLTVDRPLPKGGGVPWVVILSSVLGSVAATAVAAAAVYLYLNSRYRRWKKELDLLAKTMQSLPGVPLQVDFAVINKATGNFSETMKLGNGGFGAVYGCTLPAPASRITTTTGQTMKVAVKKFTRDLSDRRYEDFLAEVSIINRLRHKNVVPLVGWSYNKGEPLLIYEYMENGSLDQHLFHGSSSQRQLQTTAIGQWDTRYSVARDIATGLHYIHHEHEPMVLHRDIKASNIMLDSAFCARLGDFGIACTVAPERNSVTGFAGTIGYIAPECVIKWKATRQTDVYAFGVLVLELVSGKKNSGADIPADDGHISYWVWRLHREGTLLEAVDGAIVSGKNHQPRHVIEEEAKRLLLLGLACTNPNPSSRPSMTEVVQVINNVAPPPEVSLERPTLGWMPEECSSATTSSEHGATHANHHQAGIGLQLG
ncbi:hypothetical protein U9M48_030413 [Paspalum notatum var. saurae]|uniref:Protein kinase domain-containing protein n=1 Tax=Paspalum notatum var. saurae TaxID=547442 RepID=A0AAQ3X3Q6_PASNO